MQITITAPPRSLEERLETGARLLFEQEQHGDTGPVYQHYLERWLDLLRQYETRAA